MLRFSLSLLLGLVLLPPLQAASWADGLFRETVKDFGPVPRGPALQHTFLLTNSTDSTVRISGLRVSCGCVQATAPKATLAPGETGSIVATMDTTRFRGTKSVTIFVSFDQPKTEEARLWIRAISRDDVAINPDRLSFGQIKKGSSPIVTTTITLSGNRDAKIVQVQCPSNYIQPSVRETSRSRSEVTYVLSAQIRSDTPSGKWFTDIWLTTNVSSIPRIRVPLTVEVESPLSVTPPVLTMGTVKVGDPVERKVIVRGVKAFKVIGVRGAGTDVSVLDSTAMSRAVHILTIRLTPEKPGEMKMRLSIVTDLDSNEIDVYATAKVTE